MKRAFLLLLLIFVVLYGKMAYEVFTEQSIFENNIEGKLSDIAEDVTAIPLQTFGLHKIERARSVQKEGDNLFLISDDTLYRFDKTGKLICRVTDPNLVTVAGYMIDPIKGRLIVLGNQNDVLYYSFNGELEECKKLTNDGMYQRVHSASLYNNRIWTTEECTLFEADTDTYLVEKQVVEYDTSFQKIGSHKLVSADLTNRSTLLSSCDYQLGVSKESGKMYIYTTPSDPENLLRDSLLIKRRQDTYGEVDFDNEVTVYPMRFGQRYWIASHADPDHPSRAHTFCFDQNTSKSWYLKEGFKDDFHHTGFVSQLKPLDVYCNSYYFCKTNNDTRSTFAKTNDLDNAVVYIVKLKS